MVNYIALKEELKKSDLADLSDVEAANKLNEDVSSTIIVPQSFLTESGILRVLGPTDGNAALSSIETAANSGNTLLQRVVRILRDIAGGGLDFGNNDVRAQIDQLQLSGILTESQASKLKAYAERKVSRGEAVFGVAVTENEVRAAREME